MKHSFSILALALIPAAALFARAEGDPCDPGIEQAADGGTATVSGGSVRVGVTAATGTVTPVTTVRTPLSFDSSSTDLGQITLTGTSESGTYSLNGGLPLGIYDHHEFRVSGRRSSAYFGVYGDSTQPYSGGLGQRGYGFTIGGAF